MFLSLQHYYDIWRHLDWKGKRHNVAMHSCPSVVHDVKLLAVIAASRYATHLAPYNTRLAHNFPPFISSSPRKVMLNSSQGRELIQHILLDR